MKSTSETPPPQAAGIQQACPRGQEDGVSLRQMEGAGGGVASGWICWTSSGSSVGLMSRCWDEAVIQTAMRRTVLFELQLSSNRENNLLLLQKMNSWTSTSDVCPVGQCLQMFVYMLTERSERCLCVCDAVRTRRSSRTRRRKGSFSFDVFGFYAVICC